MSFTLSELPVEIIENIASTLDRTSLCSVRLACKELDRKTYYPFGHAFFATVETDLSHNSMQRLQSISQTEHIKHHVQTLLIKQRYTSARPPGEGLYWHRLGNWKFPSHVVTQLSPGFEMLRDILTELVNCQSFQIRIPGGRESRYDTDCVSSCDATTIIHSIIAETSRPIKSFHIDFRDPGFVRTSKYHAVDPVRLQMHIYQQPAFVTGWEHIEDLGLELYHNSDTLDWALNLLSLTIKLKKLSLHFGVHDLSIPFMESLLSSPTRIQSLEELSLGRINITVDMLLALLLHSQSSLRVLSLSFVRVDASTWDRVLTELRSFPLLEDFTLHWPMGRGNQGTISILRLQGLETDPIVPETQGRKFELYYHHPSEKKKKTWKVYGARFQGRVGMDKALERLAESMTKD